MDRNATRDSERESSRRQLCVEFEIEVTPESSCPLDSFGDDVESTRQQIVNGRCHTDTTLSTGGDRSCRDGSEVVHTVREVETTCFCPVFEEFGCIPRVSDVSEDGVRIETYLSDRRRLSDLVDALRSVTSGLSLRRLKRIDSDSTDRRTETAVLDLDEVTEKQREAAVTAVAAGYYARPRESSLDDLAAELGVSKSACSQRLNAVESKLAVSAFAERAGTG